MSLTGCEHRSVLGCDGAPITGVMACSSRYLHSLFLCLYSCWVFFSPKSDPCSIPTTSGQRCRVLGFVVCFFAMWLLGFIQRPSSHLGQLEAWDGECWGAGLDAAHHPAAWQRSTAEETPSKVTAGGKPLCRDLLGVLRSSQLLLRRRTTKPLPFPRANSPKLIQSSITALL